MGSPEVKEDSEYESKGCPSWRVILKENLLVITTVIGCILGLIVGFVVAPYDPSPSALMWMGMPGELYIRTLKLVIIPLVICSVVSGTSAMDPRSNGKISGVTMLWIMGTNLIGTLLGAVLALIIKPGIGVESDANKFDKDVMETEDIFADLLRNIFPDNVVAACFRQALMYSLTIKVGCRDMTYNELKVTLNPIDKQNYFSLSHYLPSMLGFCNEAQTQYEWDKVIEMRGNGTFNYTVEVKELARKYVGSANSTNVLGLFIVCAMFGVTATAVGDKGRPFLAFFRSATDVILKLMRILIWATPLGSMSLIAKNIAATDDLPETFRKLGMYIATCLIANGFWALIVLPLWYFIIKRRNPLKFFGSIMPSILIVFATVSTMIALPETFYAMEHRNNVDKRISRFVAPLSATIGRAGSASYIAISCIFLIQMVYNTVDSVDAILVMILTWFSTLAIPSVASASLVTILILLTALKIPGESAGMLFALEFLLDRSRSDTNCCTQLTGVVTVQRFCGASLPPLDQEQDDLDAFILEANRKNSIADGDAKVSTEQDKTALKDDDSGLTHL